MAKIYDPKNVSVIVDGTTITGFAEGTFVQVEQSEDSFVPYKGAQGEVSIAESNDKTGMITLTIKQTSPSHNFLERKAKEKALYPVNVVDRNSGLTYGGTECRIMKSANAEFGKEISAREYQIFVSELSIEGV